MIFLCTLQCNTLFNIERKIIQLLAFCIDRGRNLVIIRIDKNTNFADYNRKGTTMDSIHRYDSNDHRLYMLKKPNPFRLNPHLLYVGEFKKGTGGRVQEHSHEFCEILFVYKGTGSISINGNIRKIKRGDIIIYNSNDVHFEESNNDEYIEMFFMAFDKLEIPYLEKNCLLPENYSFVYESGEYFDTFYNLFKQMIEEFKSEKEFYMEVLQSISRSMLMYILRIINTKEAKPMQLLPPNKNIENAVKYIENNFRQNITLDDVAQNCYVDKFYLAHQFTKYKGMSVGKYILNLRISEALRLLSQTELSINEISQMAGFYDVSYFCRVFKKAFLVTPMQYRKQENINL